MLICSYINCLGYLHQLFSKLKPACSVGFHLAHGTLPAFLFPFGGRCAASRGAGLWTQLWTQQRGICRYRLDRLNPPAARQGVANLILWTEDYRLVRAKATFKTGA